MSKQHLSLSTTERETLEVLVRKGKAAVRVVRRALGLLELDRGKSVSEVARTLGVDIDTVADWRNRYKSVGLAAIEEGKRPGRPPQVTGIQRAQITALACSSAPEGHARWTLRLLADKVVELGYCDQISHTEVATILKKTNSTRI